MPYLGNVPAEAYSQISYQDLTGGSGTSFTLNYSVGNENEIEVFVNNVRQEPTVAYTTAGTALTMTGTIAATDDFYVVFQGKAQQTIGIPEKQTNGDYNFSSNTLYVDASTSHVGIGTASPALPLEVNGSTNVAVFRSDASNSIIQLANSTGTGGDNGTLVGSVGDDLYLRAGDAERLRIKNNGRVCIGGTNPSQKFVVTNASADNIVMCENSGASIQMFMQATSSTGSVGTLTNHDVQFLSNNTERMRIATGVSGGQVRIGTFGAFGGGNAYLGVHVNSTTKAIVTETGDTSGRSHISFRNGNGEVGGIDTGGSSTFFNTSSDYRLKENVADMTGAIDRVKALAPKRFNFIADDTVTVDGFLAHEAQAVVPEAVKGIYNEVDDDGNPVMQGIDQSKLVPLLTGALKEAIAKIEALETSNADLTARIEALENA